MNPYSPYTSLSELLAAAGVPAVELDSYSTDALLTRSIVRRRTLRRVVVRGRRRNRGT